MKYSRRKNRGLSLEPMENAGGSPVVWKWIVVRRDLHYVVTRSYDGSARGSGRLRTRRIRLCASQTPKGLLGCSRTRASRGHSTLRRQVLKQAVIVRALPPSARPWRRRSAEFRFVRALQRLPFATGFQTRPNFLAIILRYLEAQPVTAKLLRGYQ